MFFGRIFIILSSILLLLIAGVFGVSYDTYAEDGLLLTADVAMTLMAATGIMACATLYALKKSSDKKE